MAETSRARTGLFVQELFKFLIENPDGVNAKTAISHVAKTVTLTEYEKGEYSSGAGRFEKILRFATVDCTKAGWLQKDRGTWLITSDGIAAYKKFRDPEALYKEAARLYRVWKLGQPEKPGDAKDVNVEEPSDRKTSVTFEEAEDQARSEIQDHLEAFKPYDFQSLVAELLSAMGYHVSWNAPPGKDGGVDIIAHNDALGTKPPRIKVQVKRNTSSKIDADGVRSFLALVNEDDVGLYVSLGGFTRDAEDFARNQERRKITLIDVNKFVRLWIDNYPRLSDSARQRFPLSPIYFLTPTD